MDAPIKELEELMAEAVSRADQIGQVSADGMRSLNEALRGANEAIARQAKQIESYRTP